MLGYWPHCSSFVVSIEWLDGSPNLDGSSFELLWIYLTFMNGLWVVIPLLLLWDSYARLSTVTGHSNVQIDQGTPKGAPSNVWWWVGAGMFTYLYFQWPSMTCVVINDVVWIGTIVLYMILVPAVLSQAKGVPVVSA